MTDITFDIQVFSAKFPELITNPAQPQSVLQGWFDTSILYISNKITAGTNIDIRTQALYLMTAHLLYISNQIASGGSVGVMNSATVDKVSISIQPPPAANQWQYWLQSSPYGGQLLALLQVQAVGGAYYGGNFDRLALKR